MRNFSEFELLTFPHDGARSEAVDSSSNSVVQLFWDEPKVILPPWLPSNRGGDTKQLSEEKFALCITAVESRESRH